MSTEVHQAAETVTTSNELDVLFGPLFDEYFNGENQVVLKSSAVTTTDASDKRQQQPDSTSSTSTLATSVTADGNFDFFWDNNDDVDIEEEEHLAPTNSTVIALPAVDHAPSAEETEPFETDNCYDPLRAEAPSTSHSPPPHIILSHTRADTPPSGTPPSGTPTLLPIPLPTSSPHLHLLSTDRRADRPGVTLPPQKRLGIALGPRYEVGESSSAPTDRPPGGIRADYGFVATIDKEIMRDLERDVGYRIIDTWDEMLVDMPGAPATDDRELGRRITEFTTRVRQDTDEIYTRLDDEQFERQLMAGRLNMLYRDRRAHARTARLLEAEVVAQQVVITELQAADHRRQAMTEFERQHGPTKGPAQPNAPEEAGSSL
ncbi:hypothetical protein Tco_1473388 [Tanacetum coccineum]